MLKKFALFAILAISSLMSYAQETESNDKASKFGFTAGYGERHLDRTYLRTDYASQPGDQFYYYSGGGFFLGLTFDSRISENFGISSELLVTRFSFNYNYIFNTLLKYELFDSRFHLMAGPEFNLDPKLRVGGDWGNRLGMGLTGGLEFDITKRYSIYAKYSQELNNRYKGGIVEDDYEGNFNNFRLGIKFRF
ncbi:porin family protein [Gramella sp. GC03-9]|uniref:Porin family protein n=1 Tax=Christiangramia oceanisediminis TaxID=2920386 RepID=A0A9X2KYK7_9FLAO|nr:porin family protein [Gramella oceanisediminis]MCP9200748.1 porin family protein [Gramella oceanisediminis]